nr:thioredoxin domain-containing protein [Gordonia humi]
MGLGAVIVVALVVFGVLYMTRDKGGPVDDKVLAENAAFIVGDKAAPDTIDVFEDFQCPHCKDFEASSGAAIQQKVADGAIRVRFHMLNFLDSESDSGDFSSRGAGAVLCVARNGGDRDVFWKLHSALFAKSGDDPSNAEIATLAADAGATPEAQKCITDGALVDEARSMADQSSKQLANSNDGNVATPTVLSAGTRVDGITDGTGWLDDVIANPPSARKSPS